MTRVRNIMKAASRQPTAATRLRCAKHACSASRGASSPQDRTAAERRFQSQAALTRRGLLCHDGARNHAALPAATPAGRRVALRPRLSRQHPQSAPCLPPAAIRPRSDQRAHRAAAHTGGVPHCPLIGRRGLPDRAILGNCDQGGMVIRTVRHDFDPFVYARR